MTQHGIRGLAAVGITLAIAAGSAFGDPTYVRLDVMTGDPNEGFILVEPDVPNYPNGMSVSLTAVPYPSHRFDKWYHIDPNYQPEDPE